MKECRLCKKILIASEFYKTRTECKPCTKAKNKAYMINNDYNKKHYEKNKEEFSKRSLASYYDHKEDPERKLKWRNNQLKYKYGITVQDYDKMLNDQNGSCAICKSLEIKGNGLLHVDHCHDSGKVRALLCHHCNVALGSFKDNIDLLQKAIDYLKYHKEEK